MAKTSIEWTGYSWNPIAAYYEGKRGWMCSKPSKGCKGCYSERMNLRLGNGLRYTPENVAKVDWRLVNLDEPLGWRKPKMVFVCSMTDLFHKAIPFEWIGAVFGVMMVTKQHTYQVLTKRPERALEFFEWLSARALADELTQCEEVEQIALQDVDACHLQADTSPWPLPNVWIGVSAESQDEADERIPQLLQIPAAVRFLSCEPLLGPIDFTKVGYPHPLLQWHCHQCDARVIGPYCSVCGSAGEKIRAIDWIITGGESGPGARPSHPRWFRDIRDQCLAANVAYFHKQHGEFSHWQDIARYDYQASKWIEPDWFSDKIPGVWIEPDGRTSQRTDNDDAEFVYRVGKARAGRLLDGRTWDEFPTITI